MKATKADATLECEHSEECEESESFDSSLDAGEGVIRFVLVFLPFLGVERWALFPDFRVLRSQIDFLPKSFLSLEGYYLMGTCLTSSFDGSSTRG